MGQIFTAITVTNSADLDYAEAGVVPASAIRSIDVGDVLVDTGATYLCLPADAIERLGLRVERTIRLKTATGESETRIFRNARVSLMGRVADGPCVELPVGARPLLGAIPMESLGIEPELATRSLRVLPEGGPDGYIYA